MREKLSKLKTAILFPTGIDTKWDDECESSFLRFLDIVYYGALGLFAAYFIVLLAALT